MSLAIYTVHSVASGTPIQLSTTFPFPTDHEIGDGTHRRGIVNVREFEKQFGVRQLFISPGRINPHARPGWL